MADDPDRHPASSLVWIEPEIELARNYGFSAQELSRARQLVVDHEQEICDAWHKQVARESYRQIGMAADRNDSPARAEDRGERVGLTVRSLTGSVRIVQTNATPLLTVI